MPTGTTIQPLRGSYLMPRFENARVVDAMRIGVFSCPADASLREVARMMVSYHIHCVVVTDLNGGPWGVVSDLDLAQAAGPDAEERTAGEVAATEVVTVTPDETIERAAQLMSEHDTAHLVVVRPATGKPVGIVSTLD